MSDNYDIDDIINKWEKRKNEVVDKRIPKDNNNFSIDDSTTDKIKDTFENAKSSVGNFIDKTKKSKLAFFNSVPAPKNHIKWINGLFIASIIVIFLCLFAGVINLVLWFILLPTLVYFTWHTIADERKIKPIYASLLLLIPAINFGVLFFLARGLNKTVETFRLKVPRIRFLLCIIIGIISAAFLNENKIMLSIVCSSIFIYFLYQIRTSAIAIIKIKSID